MCEMYIKSYDGIICSVCCSEAQLFNNFHFVLFFSALFTMPNWCEYCMDMLLVCVCSHVYIAFITAFSVRLCLGVLNLAVVFVYKKPLVIRGVIFHIVEECLYGERSASSVRDTC